MRKRRWLRVSLAAAAVLLLASWGLSAALSLGLARRFLLAQLAASFGRPVQVAYFDFSLLDGLKLEAHSVAVMEDPRFGAEYFLRADQLTAGPRWARLLHGRLEFGTLSLTGASLNLVRNPDGHWNIESWLPPAKGSSAVPEKLASGPGPRLDANLRPAPAVRLQHISIDGGRINFKRGVEKLAFALVDLSGSVDQDNAGRWSIDLQARPARASVVLQDAGTLRLQGTVAGTSARLRPATLALSWEDASVADAIRLASGSDYGVRGSLAAEFSAKIDDAPVPAGAAAANNGWTISGVLRLADIHRWDLSETPEDPAVNLNVAASWHPGTEGLQFPGLVVEAPHSRLRAAGEVSWAHGFSPRLDFSDSQVGLEDLLAWRRAFLPGVAEGLQAQGVIGVDARLAGWPLRLEQAALQSPGAVLRVDTLSQPIRFGAMQAALVRGALVLKPVDVRLPGAALLLPPRGGAGFPIPASGNLHAEGALGPFRAGGSPRDWPYRLAVSGDTARAEDLLAVLGAFGHPASAEWSIEGPAAFQLAWTGNLRGGTPALLGTLNLHDLRVNSVLLSRPIMVSSAAVEFRPGRKLVKIDAAQALGAHWKGSLESHAPGPVPGPDAEEDWTFDLSADRLDVSQFAPWIASGALPSFFSRMFPSAESATLASAREAALSRLQAQGRLRVAELALGPLTVENLDADAQLAGRSLALRRAQGEFYGGRLTGDFQARFSAAPVYVLHAEVTRANLAALAAAFPSSSVRLAGQAAGEIALSSQGIDAEDLLAGLQGQGELRVREPVLRGLSVSGSPDDSGDPQPSPEDRFSMATARFHIAGGAVHADQFSLLGRDAQFELTGSINFARQLDLRVQEVPAGSEPSAEASSNSGRDSWVVGGTLDAPKVSRQTRLAGEPLASPAVHR